MQLRVVPDELAVVRMPPDAAPPQPAAGSLWSVTRTADELSLVVRADRVPPEAERVEAGWRALTVVGPLEFGLVGVLAELLGVLADAGVSVFVLSTYDTDLVLVRADRLPAAVRALRKAGHEVRG